MLKTPRSSCSASISPYVLASPMCCVAKPASTQILQQPLRWTSSALMYRPTLHRSLARMRGRLQLRAPARSRTFMIHNNSKGLDRFIFVGQQTRAASVRESSFWQVLQTWSSLATEAPDQTSRSCPPSLPSPTLDHGTDFTWRAGATNTYRHMCVYKYVLRLQLRHVHIHAPATSHDSVTIFWLARLSKFMCFALSAATQGQGAQHDVAMLPPSSVTYTRALYLGTTPSAFCG